MKPISVTSFRDHVQQMHAERDRGFEIEYQVWTWALCTSDKNWLVQNIYYFLFSFQSLGSDPVASHEIAKLPFNRVKNRFANIFPCKHFSLLCNTQSKFGEVVFPWNNGDTTWFWSWYIHDHDEHTVCLVPPPIPPPYCYVCSLLWNRSSCTSVHPITLLPMQGVFSFSRNQMLVFVLQMIFLG